MTRLTAISATLFVFVLCVESSTYGQGQVLRETFTFDGRIRSYNLYVPSNYDPANTMPLTLNFHGLTGSGDGQMAASGMNAVAEREDFLVAYPTALSGDWEQNNEDHSIAFTEALLDTIEAGFTIDTQRVYATGFSQGAIMSYVLASAIPNRIAAIAPVSATRTLPMEPNRVPSFLADTPERPFPLMHIHGTNDSLAPYEGGVSAIGDRFTFDPVLTILNEWIDSNGGQSLDQVSMIPGIDAADGPVSLFECQDCGSYLTASGDELTAEVILLRVNGGGHSWPASDSLVASDQIWSFFNRHQLGTAVPEPSTLLLGFLTSLGALMLRRRLR